MGVFLSHTPRPNGKIVILYGPHVGIDNNGDLGRVERVGRSGGSTACCGALSSALYGPKSNNPSKSGNNDNLMGGGQVYLNERIKGLGFGKNSERNDAEISAATRGLYGVISDLIQSQFSTAISSSSSPFWNDVEEVTFIGGIVVNRGHGSGVPGGEDYFQPREMMALRAPLSAGAKPEMVDLYGEVFGDLSAPRGTAA